MTERTFTHPSLDIAVRMVRRTRTGSADAPHLPSNKEYLLWPEGSAAPLKSMTVAEGEAHIERLLAMGCTEGA